MLATLATLAARQVAAAPDLSLYEVIAPLLVVVLLTGVIGEARILQERKAPDPTGAVSPWLRRSIYLALVVVVLVLVGETVALHVLADPPADDWEELTVIVCTSVALIAVCVLGFGPSLLAVMSERAKTRAARISFGTVLLFSALALAYAVAGALEDPDARRYRVYGTCAAQRCGLNVREQPTSVARRLAQLRDGDRVNIVCQTTGERLRTPNGVASRIWDKLDSGGYVTDLYVDTDRVGRFTPEIPGCDDATSKRPTG